MDLAKWTINNKLISTILIILTLGFGFSSYKNMARFEDPEFIIRTAQVFVSYSGASPLEVAKEVTEPLERAIQELQEVDTISSTSSTGLSEIKVATFIIYHLLDQSIYFHLHKVFCLPDP